MEETYTYDALVQFVYRELPAHKAVEMARQIEQDPALNDLFYSLLQAKTQLPKAHFNPSKTSLDSILQYSAKTAVETSF
jgi:hypothetical protein